VKPFDGPLRVVKPVRESLANSRKRVLRGVGAPRGAKPAPAAAPVPAPPAPRPAPAPAPARRAPWSLQGESVTTSQQSTERRGEPTSGGCRPHSPWECRHSAFVEIEPDPRRIAGPAALCERFASDLDEIPLA
jgi:hypothetical protein